MMMLAGKAMQQKPMGRFPNISSGGYKGKTPYP